MASEELHEGDEQAAAPKPRDPNLIFVLVNSILVLASVGMVVYTKILYKKPVIVEEQELEKKKEELTKPIEPSEKSYVAFEQLTVNIAPTSGKSHYATLTISVECASPMAGAIVKAKKSQITDRLIVSLGKRQMTELNTIQGKLLLKTELMREFNNVTEPGTVTDVFFSNFILQ